MAIPDQIRSELTQAMKSGDTRRRDTLRLLVAALNNARIAALHDLSDEEALRVLQREAKQRRDSIEEFRKGNRADLVQIEDEELAIINGYLPAELPEDELRRVIVEVIAEVGAENPGDLGKVMGPLMQRLAGRADGRRANTLTRELLGAG